MGTILRRGIASASLIEHTVLSLYSTQCLSIREVSACLCKILQMLFHLSDGALGLVEARCSIVLKGYIKIKHTLFCVALDDEGYDKVEMLYRSFTLDTR